MEYNLKTKPLTEETLTYYNIHPESYIEQALLSEDSYNNVINLIEFTDNVIDTLTKEYHHKLIGQTEKLKDKSITLNILDTVIHELTIQSIKLYVKELLTITNNHEFKDKLNIIKKININHIDKILILNKEKQKQYYEFYRDEIKNKMDKISFEDIRLEYKKYITTNTLSNYFIEIIQNIFEFEVNK